MSKTGKDKPFLVRLINRFSEWSGYISGFSILLASVIITIEVLLRYLFGITSVWQMELTIYFLIFATFVGAAYGLKHDAHVGVDIVVLKLPEKIRTVIRIITSILSLFISIILAWQGWLLWWEAVEFGWHSSSAWGPPLSIPYFILPLGMTLLTLQFLVNIYEDILSLKNKKEKDVDDVEDVAF